MKTTAYIDKISDDYSSKIKAHATVDLIGVEDMIIIKVKIIKGVYGHRVKLPTGVTLVDDLRKRVQREVLQAYAKALGAVSVGGN